MVGRQHMRIGTRYGGRRCRERSHSGHRIGGRSRLASVCPRLRGQAESYWNAPDLRIRKAVASTAAERLNDEWLHSFIESRVLELTFTAWDIEPFARDLGDDGPPFRWEEERRFVMRAELDAAFFHLYGIDRDDVDYIMETFPVVKKRDEQKYGTFRTKNLILEIYDAMAEAARTGKPYQTILDPVPGKGPRHG